MIRNASIVNQAHWRARFGYEFAPIWYLTVELFVRRASACIVTY